MKRTPYVTKLLVSWLAAGLLLAACAPAPTAPPPTAVPPTSPPTAAPPTAIPTPAATAAPTAIVPVLATSIKLDPTSVVLDADGNLYLSGGNDVYALDSAGMLTLVTGGGNFGGIYSGDGRSAVSAAFTSISAIAFDSAGNVYAADPSNNRIRRFELGGVIDSVVGSGHTLDATDMAAAITGAFAGDGGPANEAQLWAPSALAFDQQGNLYIMDAGNYRVRKVDPAGIITTIAGVGTFGFSGDGGPATEAEIRTSNGIAVDAAGNVYIADTFNARIRMIDADGIITTIAGTGEKGFSGDGGPATEAQLSGPAALAFDAQGRLYFSDETTGDLHQNHIRMIDADGIITTIATDKRQGDEYTPGGTGGIAIDAQGNVYYGDREKGLLKKIAPDGTITTVAGGGQD